MLVNSVELKVELYCIVCGVLSLKPPEFEHIRQTTLNTNRFVSLSEYCGPTFLGFYWLAPTFKSSLKHSTTLASPTFSRKTVHSSRKHMVASLGKASLRVRSSLGAVT